ncbi:MAG: cytochrome c maturation protein CcmE [Holosporales bacterium]
MTKSFFRASHRRTLFLVAGLGAGVALAWLIGETFRDQLVFFYTPTELTEKPILHRTLRLGGVVAKGSVAMGEDPQDVSFQVTDERHHIHVRYHGLLPDLFREGQGVVAEGTLAEDGVFKATQILAKHDETYMPPDAAESGTTDFRQNSSKSLQRP